jgi:hypothetical protein
MVKLDLFVRRPAKLAFALLLLSIPASVLGQQCSVRGIVEDVVDAGAGGASIYVQHWIADSARRWSVTADGSFVADRDGRYCLHLQPGIYELLFSFSAMRPSAIDVKVESGKEKVLNVRLKLSPLWDRVE